jgi:hypothetical protein
MTVNDLENCRNNFLNQLESETGFLTEEDFIYECLPLMYLSKITESDEFNKSYFQKEPVKLNGYTFNESGERLQLFIANMPLNPGDPIYVSDQKHYEKLFSQGTAFVKQACLGQQNNIQDGEPVKPLVKRLSSYSGVEAIDVVEILLLSGTISVDNRGVGQQRPRTFEFSDEVVCVEYALKGEKVKKDIIVKKKLIDFNFLYKVERAGEQGETLIINFREQYNYPLDCIQAADEENYESYLSVIPGYVLYRLYQDYSSRLLEKNVRAFLQFRGANKKMKDTIKKNPERFLAYNNGLTITAKNVTLSRSGDKIVIDAFEDFQIVNGGQTTAAIYFTGREKVSLEKVKVVAKINILKTQSSKEFEDLITNISLSSNTQTKVTNVDLSSRNPYLDKLKKLSISYISKGSQGWFFEKVKGEFLTYLNTSPNKKQLEKEFPRNRRLTKEQIAKYYVAWGEKPYMVKKGGERVFRDFVSILEKEYAMPEDMDQIFYEDLIAKVILFREFERIYGERDKAIGQLRSATVPYAISAIYYHTRTSTGTATGSYLNLAKILSNGSLEHDLSSLAYDLLKLMNKCILYYKTSDDPNEASKREDLWRKVRGCAEINEFFKSQAARHVLAKYTLTETQIKSRYKTPEERNLARISNTSPEVFFALAKWGEEEKLFDEKTIKFILDTAQRSLQNSQMAASLAKKVSVLLMEAEERGFKV